MTRIGVIGANGQVGAEVSLMLAAQTGVEVVPISRNRTGSAFLRSQGLPCRHGRVTDPDEARGLLADCDLILNFARPAFGRSAEMRAANRALVAHCARYSPPHARVVYFSSLCAYREFRPMDQPASITAYGWEKRSIERIVRREASRYGKESWILRLGHVAGELQSITAEIRRLLRCGPVVVPSAGAHASNVVYTATIVDAALAIAAGSETPGTYDMVCSPPWTWREVLERESAVIGVKLRMDEPLPTFAPDVKPFPVSVDWKAPLRTVASRVLASPRARELGLIALNFLSAESNLRAQSAHFQRRAKSEIDRMLFRPPSTEAFTFAEAGSRYLRSLRPTADLVSDPAFRVAERRVDRVFAPDLSPAT